MRALRNDFDRTATTPREVGRDALITNVRWMTLAMVVTRSTNLIFYLFLARSVGVDTFGTFVFAIAFAAAFAVVSDWGLNELTVKEIAADRLVAARYLTNGILLKMLLITLTLGGLVSTVELVGYPNLTKTAIYLAAGYFLAQSCESFFFSVFRAYEKIKYEAILTTFRDLALPVFGVILLISGAGIVPILFAYAVIGLASTVITACLVFSSFVPISLAALDTRFIIEKMCRPTIAFGLGNILLILYAKHGILMLQYLRGPEDVGWYGAADKIIDATMMVPQAAAAGLFPAFSRLAMRSRPDLMAAVGAACRTIFAAGACMAVCVAFVFAEPLVRLLYGREYLSSIAVLRSLAWSVPFVFVTRVIFVFWASIGTQNRVNLVLTAATALGVAGNLLFVPHFGILAAAVSSVVAATLVCLTIVVAVAREVGNRRFASGMAGIGAGAVLASFAGSVFCLLGAPSAITLLAIIIVYAGVLWAGRVFSKDECRRLQDALPSWARAV